ncbi:MAG: sulfurtransferase TusA family protein [Nocardioidaceae bacterium]
MSDPERPEIELDCRGLACPAPIIELARRYTEVAVGSMLAIAADDPAAGPDIAAWCRMRGHQLVGRSLADDGVPVFSVRRLS